MIGEMIKAGGWRRIAALSVLVMGLVLAVYASATGPEPGYTGAPGDIGSCVQCHDTFEQPNVGPGSVQISGNPAVYQPGQQYSLLVTVQQANRQRYGFQLTAIGIAGNQAGTLASFSADTQVNPLSGFGGRQYIQHHESGTLPNGPGRRTWQVLWTAPATDVGTVLFYVAGNAANGDGTNQNDHIYTNSALSESQSSNVTLALGTDLAGQSLEAGSTVVINWTATGTSNIQSFEARYSTDDGATFPITSLIFTSTNKTQTTHEWTVPNKPTNQARLRLQASTLANAAVEIVSGRFTITGSGVAPGPVISNAFIQGKAMFVNGSGYEVGAKVFVDGAKQKTANLEDFSHQLFCKKAGKWISPGSTVSIVVRNPDGTESPPFSFTRPAP
jgi:hypothetical protein